MSIYNLDRSKIRPEHHERAAFVYIRQSSLKQVRENLESQKRQYGFAEQARAMGWNEQQVVVVDEDQGKSGATPESRPGFARLISAVARSEVGIVMSLEVSRLSRNDADWYHLVHLCRWTGTLIADEQGIYDPSAGADRMVLGIRGQVSEIERDNSVHRMVEARWNKARRGEVFTMVPAGYDLDEIGRLSITSDQAVADAIRRVFDKFDEVGTARQVLAWWHAQGLPFPVRRLGVGGGLVVWTEVKYRAILSTLHHPFYAGAYVFGRSETRRELDPDNPHRVVIRRGQRRGLDEWPVLIKDHHPGYITFDKYLANQARIENNEMMKASKDESHSGAAREGRDGRCQTLLDTPRAPADSGWSTTIFRRCRKPRMPRPLRFVPENGLVEITTRTLQGRLLLRPSPELNDLILGVIGRAEDRYGMVIHAFVVTSTHAHYILSPTSAEQLARFMQFVNTNIAKEAGRLHLWPERLWSRRYRSIVIADDQAALARLRYVLAHGAKEGLVDGGPGAWPGANCIAALGRGELLRGTWFDRGAEYKARQRGESVLAMQFATSHDVKLTPLPCLQHLTRSQHQAEIRRMVKEIEDQAKAVNLAKGRTPMGVTAILKQDPHSRPATTDRSPAPFVHASDKKTEMEFRAKYRAFVDAFRAGAERLKKRAADFAEMFPLWSFPPALPFNAPA